jgi:antirestriction protein ArdC
MTQSRRNYQRRQPGESNSPRPADIYQQVTDRIVASLEAGTVPWRRPWRTAGGMPRSMSTGRRYQGVNAMLLGLTTWDRGYTSSWWGTRKQINAQGGMIRNGQNRANGKGATYICVWSERPAAEDEPESDSGQERGEESSRRTRVFAAMHPVFNADQCQDLPDRFYPVPGAPVEVLAGPEAMLAAYDAAPGSAPVFYDVRGEAYYDPAADEIHIPPRDQHTSAARFYSTGFHERVHSTGHQSRLDRDTVGHGHRFGTPGYGREELVAELGAAFLCAETGTETGDTAGQSAAYLASWLETIRADKKLVVQSASAAQKAADLIMEPSRQAQRSADRGLAAEDPDPDGKPDPGIEAA